ncbi:MAG: hypothetical protein WD070_02635, partial [Pirellulaceae bacterium]
MDHRSLLAGVDSMNFYSTVAYVFSVRWPSRPFFSQIVASEGSPDLTFDGFERQHRRKLLSANA